MTSNDIIQREEVKVEYKNSKVFKTLNSQEERVIKKLFELKERLIISESNEADMECNLWVKTNFKGMNLTNGDQRKAYVKKEMGKYIKTSSLYKNQINLCENALKLIRSKKRFLIETGLPLDEEEYFGYTNMIEDLCKELHIE